VVCCTGNSGLGGHVLVSIDDGRSFRGKGSNEGEISNLTTDDPHDVPGTKSKHRIRGDCVESSLTLYVDDRKAFEADVRFSSGKVGLAVDSEQDVLFVDFSASKP
jgi:hypothetical protein